MQTCQCNVRICQIELITRAIKLYCMKTRIILYLLFVISVNASAGGGWLQTRREGYFKLGQNWIIADAFYSPSGTIIPLRTNSIFTTSLYAENGLTDRITTILYFPFYVHSSLAEVQYLKSGRIDQAEYLNFIGDTDIGFKYGLIRNKKIVTSASIILGVPVGENSGGKSGILQTGDGEFNQMVRLDASTSFYPAPFYASAYVAFNNRTKGFSDEFRYGLEAGYASAKFIAIAKLNVLHSLFNGSEVIATNGVFSNNTEFVSPALELAYNIKSNVGITASGGFAFAARNILASPNWGVGIYWKTKGKK
jgi:protein XagA